MIKLLKLSIVAAGYAVFLVFFMLGWNDRLISHDIVNATLTGMIGLGAYVSAIMIAWTVREWTP